MCTAGMALTFCQKVENRIFLLATKYQGCSDCGSKVTWQKPVETSLNVSHKTLRNIEYYFAIILFSPQWDNVQTMM